MNGEFLFENGSHFLLVSENWLRQLGCGGKAPIYILAGVMVNKKLFHRSHSHNDLWDQINRSPSQRRLYDSRDPADALATRDFHFTSGVGGSAHAPSSSSRRVVNTPNDEPRSPWRTRSSGRCVPGPRPCGPLCESKDRFPLEGYFSFVLLSLVRKLLFVFLFIEGGG